MKRLMILFLAAALLLGGCAADEQPAGLIAAPEYPGMAPYPDESAFVSTGTGVFDYAEFDIVYDAWLESRREQYDQPEGYADTLDEFFQDSIPVFLSDSGSDNSICSPLNIYMALAMLSEATAGDSRQQILDLLHAESIDELRIQADHVWNAHYCADGATSTLLANSLWLTEGIQYNIDTVQTLAERCHASVYQGALGSVEMNEALQSWLNEQTGGLLREQVQNVELDRQTVLALASTVSYRAKWNSGFDADSNTDALFHSPAGDVDVTYMNKTMDHGPYYWGSDFGAVSLRLEDGSQMWLILPDEGKSVADVLESGEAMDLILYHSADWGNQKQLKVNLSLPKFDITADTRLETKLQQLGVTDVFHREAADFTPILPESEAWLGSADHVTRVAIDEEGITAVAYTVIQAPGAAPPPEDEVDFVLNRPFLFVITSRDNLPLFAGTVNQP